MALLIELDGKRPRVGDGVFLAPNATLIGDVVVADGASVWFGAVLRADIGPIRIGARANVQDNCTVHSETADGTVLEDEVTVGHGAVLHDCRVGWRSVIGMNAVVLQRATIGAESLVGAGSIVREGFAVPERSLVVGIPALVKRSLDGNAAAFLEHAAQDYIGLTARYRAGMRVIPEA